MSESELIQVLLAQISKLDERTQQAFDKLVRKVDDLQAFIADAKAMERDIATLQDTVKKHEERLSKSLSWQDKLDGKIIGISCAASGGWVLLMFLINYIFKLKGL